MEGVEYDVEYEVEYEVESLWKIAMEVELPSEMEKLVIKTQNIMKELINQALPNKPNPALYSKLNGVLSILNLKIKQSKPHAKFAFKSHNSFSNTSNITNTVEDTVNTIVEDTVNNTVEDVEETVDSVEEKKFGENYIIKNIKNQTILRVEDERLGSISLENIDRCRIFLLNASDSCFIYNSFNSILCVGVVSGSVMISGVRDSVIIATSRQLRVSNSHNTKLHINTITPPIIERSAGIVFVDNSVVYEWYVNHLELSGLGLEFPDNKHLIKDFTWHHQTKSPNFTILPKLPEISIPVIQPEPNIYTINQQDLNHLINQLQ